MPTFLFTDIEGSTRRWEQWPTAMAAALTRHDALVADAVAAHGGSVFKTVGDAFCIVFADPASALAAAIDAQGALAAENWSCFDPELPAVSVRTAIHTGPAEARGGDYFGPAVNRVARLLGAGHGGQVLLSDSAAELLADRLPAGVTLRSLGRHRLKDLALPVEVFQADVPDLESEFPPLTSLDRIRHNLPHQVTSFVGREDELAALRARLAASRLITLAGAGGTSKTRLALQLAAECLEDFSDGIFFVDLAPLNDPSLVPGAALQAVGVPLEPGRPAQDTLLDFLLRHPRLVLVLDNCEHVLPAVAELAHKIVTSGPETRLLATSREPLAVAGEIVWPLAPLATPDPRATPPTPAALVTYDAVRLFVDRAEAALPGFAVTDANAAAVAGICRRLDGIPLAIELAAARVRLFSPAELAGRLDARFHLLTRGNRAALPRHQTLRACLDWSYELLPEVERRVFERLGVFAGSIPLDAAEMVCADGDADADAILDALVGLEAKSLVVADRSGEQSTVRLLETMRAYARERLAESGDEPATRDRHLAWVGEVLAEMSRQLRGSGQVAAVQRVGRQHDDLRAALTWGLANPRLAAIVIAWSEALWRFWSFSGHLREGGAWFGQFCRSAEEIGLAEIDPSAAGWAHWAAGCMSGFLGDEAAAVRHGAKAAAYFARAKDDFGRACVLVEIDGRFALSHGDLDLAEAKFEAGATLLQQTGDDWQILFAITNLGEVARVRGDFGRAARLYEEVLSNDAGPFQLTDLWPLHNLGWVRLHLGELAEAYRRFAQCMQLAHEVGSPGQTVGSMAGMAAVASRSGQPRRAGKILGAAESFVEWTGYALEVADRQEWDATFAEVQARLDPPAWDAARAEGAAWSLDEAVAYALAIDDEL